MENKGQNEKGIIILSTTGRGMCGGTDATLDTNAPKRIVSNEMFLFNVTSVLGIPDNIKSGDRDLHEPLEYVSAFAAAAGSGTFLFLEKCFGFRKRGGSISKWAFVDSPVFPSLAAVVREYDLAKNNGYHSKTHGLPDNFGGSADIRYAGGERISFSDNQSPVISYAVGTAVAETFENAMKGEPVALPDVSALEAIRFYEKRDNGGFTEATLTLYPDGTGRNEKRARSGDPKIYESVKTVSAETVAEIKEKIADTGILAWAELPDNGFSFGGGKKLTFVFSNGREITVTSGKILPDQISGGFFDIELELVTNN